MSEDMPFFSSAALTLDKEDREQYIIEEKAKLAYWKDAFEYAREKARAEDAKKAKSNDPRAGLSPPRPARYFFCGTLKDPKRLSEVLGVDQHKLPKPKPGFITSVKLKYLKHQPVLVKTVDYDDEVHGFHFDVLDMASVLRLHDYAGEKCAAKLFLSNNPGVRVDFQGCWAFALIDKADEVLLEEGAP